MQVHTDKELYVLVAYDMFINFLSLLEYGMTDLSLIQMSVAYFK